MPIIRLSNYMRLPSYILLTEKNLDSLYLVRGYRVTRLRTFNIFVITNRLTYAVTQVGAEPKCDGFWGSGGDSFLSVYNMNEFGDINSTRYQAGVTRQLFISSQDV